MSRYLDPKSDLVFKKIFAEHPHLLISFLNAVLPLAPEQHIAAIEYLPSELAPRIPGFKSTIVDVRCTDKQGRLFIVEMQIQWTTGFMQRMLFNASKAYIKQLNEGEAYHLLKPVYGLALLASEFDSSPSDWYHHYKMVNAQKPACEIKDLQLIFVELPKFKAQQYHQKKLQILWLRFMSELDKTTTQVASELLAVPEINEAIRITEQSAYSREELDAYDYFWDAVSTERTLKAGAYLDGLAEGKAKGMEEGKAKGMAEGKAEGKAEAKAEILLQIIRRKFNPVLCKDDEVCIAAKITQANVAQLTQWIDDVFDVITRDDLFKMLDVPPK